VQPSSEKVDLSSIPTSSNSRCTDRKLYRTQNGGSVYYYLAEISDNTTTTYTDNTTDGNLDTTKTAPSDNGGPPDAKFIIVHKERLFLARDPTNKSRVWYSWISGVTSYPDIFPASNYIEVSPDDGDEIMALAHDPMGHLCVFKKRSIRKIFTEGDPSIWEVSDPFSPYGATASDSVVETPKGIVYLTRTAEGKKQLRIFNGNTSEPISDRVSPTLDNITESQVQNAIGWYVGNTYKLAYADAATGFTYNSRVLIFDMLRDAFGIDIKNVESACVWGAGDDWGEEYTGTSDATGFVYREDTALEDLVHDTKTEIDTGTYSQTVSSGSDSSPVVKLVQADISDDVGAQIVSTLTAATEEVQDYTAEQHTVSPSGTLISTHLEINAKTLSNIYWSETLGSYGDVEFWVRTGDTTEAVDAAAWEGPYSTPGGSDISGVTAAVYIQYKTRLYITDVTQVATLYLDTANNYVVKISAGYGTPAESSFEMQYTTGQLNMGHPNRKKWIRSIIIEHEGTSGTLSMFYSVDRGSETQVDIALATYTRRYRKNLNAFGELFQLRLYYDSITALEIKRIIVYYSVEPDRYTSNLGPYEDLPLKKLVIEPYGGV
jgi:hypothetical protein